MYGLLMTISKKCLRSLRIVALGSLWFSLPVMGSSQSALTPSDSDQNLQTALVSALERSGDNRLELEKTIQSVPEDQRHGAEFLIAYMPEQDLRTLSSEYLTHHIHWAYHARENSPWGSRIPEEIFLNDVLPYASINERRDAWRKDFWERFYPMVENCQTTGDVAQILNRDIYRILDVQYHASKRPKPDQSPYESIEAKFASCTGLSVLLIDACRAVGVPARFVGTPSWTTKRGNHSWVEIWDDGKWRFAGACEFDKNGLDRGWFVGDASKAIENSRRHAIYASSWKSTGESFPMIWARDLDFVPAVNVTRRYAPDQPEVIAEQDAALWGVRIWDKLNGERLVFPARILLDGRTIHSGRTTGENDDSNNWFEAALKPETDYQLEIMVERGEWINRPFRTGAKGRQTLDLTVAELSKTDAIESLEKYLGQPRSNRETLDVPEFAEAGLNQEQAALALDLIWADHASWIRETRAEEIENRVIELGDLKMPFFYKLFGDDLCEKRSLIISMHGGGGAPSRVNDRQYENQKRLYNLNEGLYLAPRAPTDTWNLWHQSHIDEFFARLIEDLIVFENVDPDRVYLTGYSAGGDGTHQLAPRMADRFAAAAMMAGHPNETSPLGLRNLPYTLHMGGADAAYSRNRIAGEWKEQLAELHRDDPDGYRHWVRIYEGVGHWMNGKDVAGVVWMKQWKRNRYPDKIVWKQDDVTHDRFYWIGVPDGQAKARALVTATIDGQVIRISSDEVSDFEIWLNDAMLNLDQPVEVFVNDVQVFASPVKRTLAAMLESFQARPDPSLRYSAKIEVSAKKE